jgi:hypothetical protein
MAAAENLPYEKPGQFLERIAANLALNGRREVHALPRRKIGTGIGTGQVGMR